MSTLTRTFEALHRKVDTYRLRWSDDRGASATEYAIIVAIVVAALVGIGALFGQTLANLWDGMIQQISGFTS
jgi:Flp pilus assembly pilin Flp